MESTGFVERMIDVMTEEILQYVIFLNKNGEKINGIDSETCADKDIEESDATQPSTSIVTEDSNDATDSIDSTDDLIDSR